MFSLPQVLCALLLPMALALVAGLRGRDLLDGSAGWAQRGLGGALLAALYLVAHAASVAAIGVALAPPVAGWNWLPWIAAGLVPVIAFAAPPGRVRWAVQIAAAAAGAWILLRPMAAIPLWQVAAWAAGCAAMVFASGTLAARGTPTAQLGSGALIGGLIAIGAFLTRSKDLALLAAIVPMTLIALWVVWRRAAAWPGGLVAVAHLLAWHLLLNATYSEMPWWLAAVFAAALPIGGLAARLGSTPGRRTALQLTATALVGLIAIGLAVFLATEPATDASAYGY